MNDQVVEYDAMNLMDPKEAAIQRMTERFMLCSGGMEELARIAIEQGVVPVWRSSWCIICQGTAKELDGSGPCHGCDGTGLNPIPWDAVCAGEPLTEDQKQWLEQNGMIEPAKPADAQGEKP